MSKLRIAAGMVFATFVVCGLIIYSHYSHGEQLTPLSMVKSHETVEQSVEFLPDRIIVRVPAEKILRPATTTPLQPDPPESDWFYSDLIPVPEDTVITGFEVEIERADLSTLHHTRVGIYDRAPIFCDAEFPRKDTMHELFAASRNIPGPAMLPEPYGIVVRENEQLLVEFMTHAVAHPHGAHDADESVLPILKLTMFTDLNRTTEAHFVRLRLDDSPCAKPSAHQAFAVPATGETYTKTAHATGTARFVLPEAGRIFLGGANLWPRKGGRSVSLYQNGDSVAVALPEPGVNDWEWELRYEEIDVPFAVGDELHISSDYRNPFDEMVKDASAMFGLYYTFEEPIEFDTE